MIESTEQGVETNHIKSAAKSAQANESQWHPPAALFQESYLYGLEGPDIFLRVEEGKECFWFTSHLEDADRREFISEITPKIDEKVEAPFVLRGLITLSRGTEAFAFETIPAHEDNAECEEGRATTCLFLYFGERDNLRPAGFVVGGFHYSNWHEEVDDIWATLDIEVVFLLEEFRGQGASESLASAIAKSFPIPWLQTIESYRKERPDYQPGINLTLEMEAVSKGGRAVFECLYGEGEMISDLNEDNIYDFGDLTIDCINTH